MKIKVEEWIDCSYQEVFNYIADFENNPKWQGGMVDAKFTTEGPVREGSQYDQIAKFLGKKVVSTFVVKEFESDKRIRIESISGSFPIIVTRSVEPSDHGTQVTTVVEGDANKFFKLTEPVIKFLVKRSVQSDYKRLKYLLEGRSS